MFKCGHIYSESTILTVVVEMFARGNKIEAFRDGHENIDLMILYLSKLRQEE